MIPIQELARQVGRSICTLRRWESEGRIPTAHRIGLRGKRHWTEDEAVKIRVMLGVSPPPTLAESLTNILDRVPSSSTIDDLIEALPPDIKEGFKRLLCDKALQQGVTKALLGEGAAAIGGGR